MAIVSAAVRWLRYHAVVVIDIHTHVFPREVRDNRDEYLKLDGGFRELYSRPDARVATTDELLASMDTAGVDRSVICGHAWANAELCCRHNDALLEAASRSAGRLMAFCTAQPSDPDAGAEIERCVAGGARGLGELRPVNQGYRLLESQEAALLGWAAEEQGLALLFHASEPVGHVYPGKAGLPLGELAGFIAVHPGATIIAAHWGGGLPFFALMPEVRSSLSNTYFDTAATSFLYRPQVYAEGTELAGAGHILFGSDFPLVSQEHALRELREAIPHSEARRAIEGENAARLLGLANG